jgi:hypothetical protein
LKHIVDLVRAHFATQARVGELFFISEAASSWPWLHSFGQLLLNGLLLLPLLVLLSVLARRRIGKLRFYSLLVSGVLLFVGGLAHDVAEFAVAGAIVLLQLGGMIYLAEFLFRGHDLAFVFAYLAGVGFVHAFEWLQQPVTNLQISGGLLALLVAAALVVLALLGPIRRGSAANSMPRMKHLES